MENLTIATLHPAREYGPFGCSPWGHSVRRPVPLIDFGQKVTAPYEKTGPQTYVVTLPRCLHVMPSFQVEAAGGEVIDIRSDRYSVSGGPGDNRNTYLGQRTKYICKTPAEL